MSRACMEFTYLSLGAGVQSSALLVASVLGLHGVPRADLAVFADTQGEPQYVYDYLGVLEEWSKNNGGPRLLRVTAGDLAQAAFDYNAGRGDATRYTSLPMFVMGSDDEPSIMRRQCTREFKVTPIEKGVREFLGYKARQRIRHKVRCLVGISLDEIVRVKPSKTKWIERVHPLVDAGLTRADCLRIVTNAGLPLPEKSACVYCPYHDDAYWLDLKTRRPEEFERACVWDERLRDQSRGGLLNPAFLHRSLRPLREVDFAEGAKKAEAKAAAKEERFRMPLFDNFAEECEGVCGI